MARWVRDNRRAVAAEIREALADGLSEAGVVLLGDAGETTPFEEGILLGSGYADPASSGDLEAAVGYNTVYAVYQHEDVTLKHPGKGRHHWLERTLLEETDKLQGVVAERVRRAL